ncbi:hypothetical protein A0J61_01041 [Choanephora cucurbitarum]|uniref:Uncharacterized protein n=1 Tax=Choanephora cucurbitarum TaxID=101091 RepID=A0A1C7NPR2_9FUNG|nr:hypothetical protein A0J61_01041 [Choanephora cucurbitarum]
MTISSRYSPIVAETAFQKQRQSLEIADLKKDNTIPTSRLKEDILLETEPNVPPATKVDTLNSSSTTTVSSMNSKTSNTDLLSKLSQANKSPNKPINSKKNALYSYDRQFVQQKGSLQRNPRGNKSEAVEITQ